MEDREAKRTKEAPEKVDAWRMNVAEFQAVTDHYKQDLREFFTRSNFYLAVQGALVYGLATRERSGDDWDVLMDVGVSVLGVVLCLFWWLVAHGSHFWIQTWREKVQNLSQSYSQAESYHDAESLARKYPWRSPETVTKHLPLVFACFWIAMAIGLVWLRR